MLAALMILNAYERHQTRKDIEAAAKVLEIETKKAETDGSKSTSHVDVSTLDFMSASRLNKRGGSYLLPPFESSWIRLNPDQKSTASRMIGQVMQCPPPRPRPSSAPTMVMTSMPALRSKELV